MSKQLFQAPARPFHVYKGMSISEFMSSASGRWETVGMVFCVTGLATEWISEDDLILRKHDSVDTKVLATTASTVCDICLQFCDSVGIVNDLVSWLLVHQTALLAIVYGESDYRPWKKLGDLATAIFALGLHQDSSQTTPFFLNELRKRTMVAAFTMDKELATFLGRPPLISWRYCNISYPLDVSFEELLVEPTPTDDVIARLQKNQGWNSKDTLTKGSWARIILLRSIQREKVLELSLGSQSEDLQAKVSASHQMCYFGLPAAGILCAELLRQSQSPAPDKPTEFPRSEVIQSLSVFASHLENLIQPNEGNYHVSQQGQRSIGRVLDQVLSVNSPPSTVQVLDALNKGSLFEDLFQDVNENDRGALLDWLGGTVEHRPDSWLGWVNFS
ncbi:Transcription factor [Penicillium macrosclerotiorum]|uniref:Transcription factor n=1 Tax=Penicillium macrosclerotiorum TaxID=303699 RepID=UPI0025486C19|nr:Transcription factor [Penicillium macrosclerotiorum]KAJ5666574.1 Transcription factor [Penicillium macrosclerotiorum]